MIKLLLNHILNAAKPPNTYRLIKDAKLNSEFSPVLKSAGTPNKTKEIDKNLNIEVLKLILFWSKVLNNK